MFLFKSGLRFPFPALEVPEPRVRKGSFSLTKMTFSSLCCQHVLTHTSEEPDRAKGEVRKCWHWAGIAINQCSDSLHHYLLFLMIKILRVRDWERLTMALIRDCWQFSDAILNLCMYYEGGPGTSCFFSQELGEQKCEIETMNWKGPATLVTDCRHRWRTTCSKDSAAAAREAGVSPVLTWSLPSGEWC